MNAAARRWQWGAMAVLAVGLATLLPGPLLSWLTLVLGVLTALKLREARSLGEGRLVGLLQLLTAGMLAALQPELAPSLLQALACLLALAGLLALEMGAGQPWRVLLRRSLQLLLAALPMALVLFLLLPRFDPLTSLPQERGTGAVTGLSPDLEPGSIAELVASNAPAARVAFPGGSPPPLGERYWRVLVHDRFDGRRWSGATTPAEQRQGRDLPEAPGAPSGEGIGGNAAQLWLEEPSGLATVPWSGRGRPLGRELRLERSGELRHRGPSDRRRVYALGADPQPAPWQRQPPGALELQLPPGADPRLEALAADWARLGPTPARLAAAERWFRRQPFRYTLQPGTLPPRAPLDAFLFERREGFCGHYASAFTALMRAAGVPARVVSGYRGGDWVVPLGGAGYLDLRRSHAHAWSEVWLEGEGWRRVDPTAWIAGGAPAGASEARGGAGLVRDPLGWLQRQWWGLDLAWTRWWLGFDRQDQEALLQRLLGERGAWLGVLLLVALVGCLAGALAALGWLQRRQERRDPLQRELERWLRNCARLGMAPQPGETLPRFAARLARRWPELEGELTPFVALVQRQRYGAGGGLRQAQRQLRERRQRLGRRLQRLPP